jgi:8-oxo-dGTP pyrophosphatase MutT (NUDIX family)
MMARTLSIAAFLWVFGCSLMLVSEVSLAQQQPAATVKAAGCVILTPEGVVLGIGTSFGDIRIPFGSHKTGETARQTAARETKEETGIDVDVRSLLQTFENGSVFLFRCIPVQPIDDYSRLSPGDTSEIAEIIVLDPGTMLTHDGRKIKNAWRFADDSRLLTSIFQQYKAELR